MLVDQIAKNRFWEKVNISTDIDCWNWIACVNRDGYGRIAFNGRAEKAHRISWMIHFGNIPNNLFVLHHCDNPPCVNPKHLFLGTQMSNMRDMIRKGRNANTKGDKNGRSKLSNEEVTEIRKIWDNTIKYHGLLTNMANIYNVHKATMNHIVSHNTWKSITN